MHHQHIPEDGSISLHGLLHVQTNLRGRKGTRRTPDLVQELHALETSLIRDLLVWLAGGQSLLDVVSASTTEDDDVEKGVGTETVSTVDRHASSLSSSIQARNNLVLAVLKLITC